MRRDQLEHAIRTACQDVLDTIAARVAEVAARITISRDADVVLHGDCTPANVLVQDGHAVALLDFEWSRRGPRSRPNRNCRRTMACGSFAISPTAGLIHSGLGSQRNRRIATAAPIMPQAARTARCRQSAPVCRDSGPVSASLKGRIGSQPVTRLSS
jgi:hypothetical protein